MIDIEAIQERLDKSESCYFTGDSGRFIGDDAGALLAEVRRLREIEHKWWELQNALYLCAYKGASVKQAADDHLEPEAYEHDYRYER